MMKSKIFSLSLILIILISLFTCFKPTQVNASEAKVEVSNGKVVLNTGYNTQDDAFSHILDKYKTIITFFSAIAAVTMVAIFIYTFTKLGASATNPMERSKCLTGLLVSGIAAALLGSVALFTGLFYGAFKD